MIKFKDIKVVILCGGLGSRLSEETSLKPKPMIKIEKIPFASHYENLFKIGFKNFILALGYKHKYIIRYFKNSKIDKSI